MGREFYSSGPGVADPRAVEARTLNCRSCGAAVTGDSPRCDYCQARVQTLACPSCFGMLFLGSRYCPHCGAPSIDWDKEQSRLACPGCREPLRHGTLGTVSLHECEACLGVWIAKTTFEEVCRSSERQASFLAAARPEPEPTHGPGKAEAVRYRSCPLCRELMHRVNFARCSGVVVDVCRDHGTWFDAGELQRIVCFIRNDGLAIAREREKQELERAARRLEVARQARPHTLDLPEMRGSQQGASWLGFVLEAAGELLGSWLRR